MEFEEDHSYVFISVNTTMVNCLENDPNIGNYIRSHPLMPPYTPFVDDPSGQTASWQGRV